MSRQATALEIMHLLRTRFGDVQAMLGEPKAQLSLPTDGKGARVLARVPHPPARAEVTLVMTIDDQKVEFPVQLTADLERVRAYGHRRPTMGGG